MTSHVSQIGLMEVLGMLLQPSISNLWGPTKTIGTPCLIFKYIILCANHCVRGMEVLPSSSKCLEKKFGHENFVGKLNGQLKKESRSLI